MPGEKISSVEVRVFGTVVIFWGEDQVIPPGSRVMSCLLGSGWGHPAAGHSKRERGKRPPFFGGVFFYSRVLGSLEVYPTTSARVIFGDLPFLFNDFVFLSHFSLYHTSGRFLQPCLDGRNPAPL